MKTAFLGLGSYAGPAPPFDVWPAPPAYCDRAIASKSLRQTIALCRRAEELGFDWISVSEHHYAPYMMTPNPLVLAGALSQVIQRARIALLGPLIPLNNPIRLAEEIAMLDSMTDGRVVVLFLRGTPNEFFTYDTNVARTHGMTQEGIDLILKAWTESEPFSWEGEHYKFSTVSVWPRLRQEALPPMFASGSSAESVTFAAKRRLGIAFSFAEPEAIRKWIDSYREHCRKEGWEPTAEHVLYRGLAHAAESDAQAESELAAHYGVRAAEAEAFRAKAGEARIARPTASGLTPARGQPPPLTPLIVRPYFLGSPSTILQRMQTLHECGVGVVDMDFVIGSFDQQWAAMELCARKVLPETRGW
jgi:alkanesulfonate monooxygenase SsuD/methylene tetrahydromethanopterin reductase-like flavin-dependent oxidoreductase (luciferase family)